MHRIDKEKRPLSLVKYVQKFGISRSYSTGIISTFQLHNIPSFKTTKLQNSFLYQDVKIWTSTRSNIKLLSYSKFKLLTKQLLFDDK